MLGQVLGNYRIVSLLGEGGMGQVYLAEHALIGRKAAVKVLLPQHSHRKEIVGRFFNEARAATAIRHPGIVEIYDFGYHDDGSGFIVMELLEGDSLTDRLLARGPMPVAVAFNFVRQVAGALAAAHDSGVVHRDLKPDNIFLVPDSEMPGGERAKVLDFGIAKLTEEGGDAGVKTRTGTVMGTPAYMAPEQCRGAGSVDHRADLYALGCILYEALAGRPPFTGEGAGEILAAHIHVAPGPPSRYAPHLHPDVDALVLRLLAKDPDDRYASARELTRMLMSAPGASGAFADSAATPAVGTAAPGGTSPQSPTTLSSATGQADRVPGPGGGARLWLGLAVVGLLGIAGLTAGLLVSGGGDRAAAQPLPAAPVDAAAVATRPFPDARVPADPERVEIVLESEPEGAVVYRMPTGVRVGTTPYRAEVARARGELVFLLSKRGYRDRTLALSADSGGTERVELEPIPRRRGGARSERAEPAGSDRRRPRGDDSSAAPDDPGAVSDEPRTLDPFDDDPDDESGGTLDPFHQ